VRRRGQADFVEALLADRPPNSFRASPEEADVLRVAMALRAARPGAPSPNQAFVSRLACELAEQVGGCSSDWTTSRCYNAGLGARLGAPGWASEPPPWPTR
jgi:hypothetical protein